MDVIRLIIYVAMAVGVVLFVERQSRRAQAQIKNELSSMRKSLNDTSSILHEFQKFKAAFDNSYDAMLITDATGKILYVNDSALRINGFSRQEVIGTKAGALWGGLMPKAFYKNMWQCLKEDQEAFSGRLTNRRKNGERYEADITVSPLFDDEHEGPYGFVGIERDLTVRQKVKSMAAAK